MTRRAAIVVLAVGILGVAAWTFIPPFPAPDTLAGRPLPTLVGELGAPTAGTPTIASDTTVVWEKTRGIGVWSLRLSRRPEDYPRYHGWTVSRCLRIRGAPEASSFCRLSVWTKVEFVPCDRPCTS